MAAIVATITYSAYGAVSVKQLLHTRAQQQTKARVTLRFGSNELQKLRLGQHHDIGKFFLDAAKVSQREWPGGRGKGGLVNLAVAKLVESFRETELVHNVQDRRVNCVAAKVAIEILVRFQ